MRKVIWVQGAIPKDMHPKIFNANIKLLSNSVGGELVAFGTDSHMIIGDERAEARLKGIEAQAKK